MSERDLQDKLESKFDPSDTDAAMQLAYRSLKLMRLILLAVNDDNNGLRLGRDQKIEMCSAVTETATWLGLLDSWAPAEEIAQFREELLK